MNQLRVVVLGSTVLAVVGAVLAGVAGAPVASPSAMFQGTTACVNYNVPGKESAAFTAPISNLTDQAIRLRSVVPTRLVGLTDVEEWVVEKPSHLQTTSTTVWDDPAKVPGWTARKSVDGATVAAHSNALLVVSGVLKSNATSGYAQDFVTTVYGPFGILHTGAKDSGGFGLLSRDTTVCLGG